MGLTYLYKKYQNNKNKMLENTINDPALWDNDYPIVLIHGLCGSTMDENPILGGYFHYAFSHISRYLHYCDEENQ